ncbi:nucleotide sugar dehydrogenase [Candidatus Bathyarchaeota archaeon]|nr:nucleotide sugar dehydrogenase [Candidatus Bathyarchaeota archaeon]
MKAVVVGMGYVGAPLAALLADAGLSVVGVQRRSERSGWKIDTLNSGASPYMNEPGLGELLQRVVSEDRLSVSDGYEECRDADCVLVTVQTPVDEEKKPKLGNLKEVFMEVGGHMRRGTLVSLESTVPPRTTTDVVKPILEEASGLEAGSGFNLVFSYERVTPGRLIHNIRRLPRVVGGYTPACTERGVRLYERVCEAEVHGTDSVRAETAKLIENTYRDVNIAFANEAAMICETLGTDFYAVRDLVNGLPFIDGDRSRNPFRDLHYPGAGVGGHCLPKDSWLLTYGAEGAATRLIRVARQVNDGMPSHMRRLIVDALRERGMNLKCSRVALLGLAFKEETEDARNSPTLALYGMLMGEAEGVVVHDPYVRDCEGVNLTGDMEEALRGVDCLVLMTRHSVYSELGLGRLMDVMNTPVIVDGRNVFDPDMCRAAGFTYRGVGHPAR